MEYPNIMKRIDAECAAELAACARLVQSNEFYAMGCVTDLKNRMYANGEISRDKLNSYAFQRQANKICKYFTDMKKKVSEISKADPADTIHIQTWVTPSRVVYADVLVPGEETHIRKSQPGGGCNRETTATAMALNASPEVMRIVYDAWEEALARNPDIRIHDFYCGCFYGNSVPEFVGRATMSYFEEFFKSRYYNRTFHFCNDPRETSVWVFTRYDADETKGRC